jgi:pyruvate formate lyase activating enzyme
MRAHRASVADVIPFSWVDGPGNRFVLFLQGCNFNCQACHNPQTIPVLPPRDSDLTVDDVLTKVRASMPYISGVTLSGGEATLQHEFVHDLFAAIKADAQLGGLTTFIDSNGSASPEVWRTLAPVTDGVMVDLKVLDAQRHLELTGEPNQPVLDSIVLLASLGLLYEVRLLLVPGQNDSDDELARTARWLRDVDPGIRVKLNSFMVHGVRPPAREWPEATSEDLARYRAALLSEGLVRVV